MEKIPPTYTGPVIIVGNGGSCDAMPPEFWRQDVPYIGTNRCLALSACQGVKWSAVVMRDCYRRMFAKKKDGWRYHNALWKPCTAYKVGAAHDRVTHCDEYVRQAKGWQLERVVDSENKEAAVMRNSSVVLMAANWAWIQGARVIRLIGVDYCMPHHAKMVEPWCSMKQGDTAQYERPVRKQTVREFGEAASAIYSAGGRFVNMSLGTALDVVEKAHA